MASLSRMPREEAARIEALLFDLDDTVLDHGLLTRVAYDAICDLAAANVHLIAVTGRPAGWGEVLARQWPLVGVVAENGAALLVRDGQRIVRSLRHGASRDRLRPLVDAIRAAHPEVELADDNDARVTDVTFDIGERNQVDRATVDAVRARVIAAGARAIVSSVHLHATFEPDDKASGVLRLLRERLQIDPSAARARCAFVGDSENDAACFSFFRTTVGVANVMRAIGRLSVPPRYVTPSPMGAGFAELANALISARA